MPVPRIESVPAAAGLPTLYPPQTLRLPTRRRLRHPRSKRSRRRRQPVLRFSPFAWAKLLFLRDQGETEVGGFGISADDDPFFVTDVRLVRQTCTVISVAFDDVAVADFFDEQVEDGRPIGQVGRIWIHTHPGDCAAPSGLDEATFARVFGRPDWAVMFILARQGETYGRLRFNTGPGAELVIRAEVDFGRPFEGGDCDCWLQEYSAAVQPDVIEVPGHSRGAEPRLIPNIPEDLGGFEPEDVIWG